MRVAVDTNLLIYLLSGDQRVADFLNDLECHISSITELELFAKKNLKKEEMHTIQEMVDSCVVSEMTPEIKKIAKKLII